MRPTWIFVDQCCLYMRCFMCQSDRGRMRLPGRIKPQQTRNMNFVNAEIELGA